MPKKLRTIDKLHKKSYPITINLMNKMRSYRNGTTPYSESNPPVIYLPDSEFGLFLEQNPNIDCLPAINGKWQRKFDVLPTTKEEFENFFAASAEYVQRSATPRAWKYALHREILQHYFLPEMMGTVLDFGCGAGNDGMFYANLGCKVTFADVDGVNLQFIRWRLQRRMIDCCEVIPSDDPLGTAVHDLVLIIDSLEHIVNAGDYFARIHDSLKTNGLLCLSFHSVGTGLDCYSADQFKNEIQPILDEEYKRIEDQIYRKIS